MAHLTLIPKRQFSSHTRFLPFSPGSVLFFSEKPFPFPPTGCVPSWKHKPHRWWLVAHLPTMKCWGLVTLFCTYLALGNGASKARKQLGKREGKDERIFLAPTAWTTRSPVCSLHFLVKTCLFLPRSSSLFPWIFCCHRSRSLFSSHPDSSCQCLPRQPGNQ